MPALVPMELCQSRACGRVEYYNDGDGSLNVDLAWQGVRWCGETPGMRSNKVTLDDPPDVLMMIFPVWMRGHRLKYPLSIVHWEWITGFIYSLTVLFI